MTLLAGHITPEQAESSDPTLGIEFEPEHHRAVVYIDEGGSQTEVSLTQNQVWQFGRMCSQVLSEWHWHDATWVSASEGSYMDTTHLMKKGEHHPKGKTLCGRLPANVASYGEWKLAPVLGAPSRTKRSKFTSGTCQHCLAAYDKRIKEHDHAI